MAPVVVELESREGYDRGRKDGAARALRRCKRRNNKRKPDNAIGYSTTAARGKEMHGNGIRRGSPTPRTDIEANGVTEKMALRQGPPDMVCKAQRRRRPLIHRKSCSRG
jgi:hypothetical protein